ncbi:hypothetical protein M153_5800005274 [Pseudoloma neurophilia]|uniref:Uncharacterized protein n=1 Tax=Pseudoloma neurophilia TaxID=146866 RepID=A0A0R0LWQ0_9MICR|nr:hypothetical protein M153_5800005274 [Pseudoloma neurophilia]
MSQMTDRDYSTTKATDHRGKNLSKANNKVPYLKSVFVRHVLGMQITYEQGNSNQSKRYNEKLLARSTIKYYL